MLATQKIGCGASRMRIFAGCRPDLVPVASDVTHGLSRHGLVWKKKKPGTADGAFSSNVFDSCDESVRVWENVCEGGRFTPICPETAPSMGSSEGQANISVSAFAPCSTDLLECI